MTDTPNCWNCKHERISEHGHEWLDCMCQLDHKWHDIMVPHCNGFEPKETEEDDGGE